MRFSMATSARRGTLSRVSVSSVSRLAIISGRAAFLAPEIGIVPFKRLPPTMRMRSMTSPLQSRALAPSLPDWSDAPCRDVAQHWGGSKEGRRHTGEAAYSGLVVSLLDGTGRSAVAGRVALRRRRLARNAAASRASLACLAVIFEFGRSLSPLFMPAA